MTGDKKKTAWTKGSTRNTETTHREFLDQIVGRGPATRLPPFIVKLHQACPLGAAAGLTALSAVMNEARDTAAIAPV